MTSVAGTLGGKRRRIAIFNTNATHRDPRVLRVGGMLAAAGHDVVVFEMRVGNQAERETLHGMEVRRVAAPTSYGDQDMYRIAELVPEAAAVIRIANAYVWQFSLTPALHMDTPARLWHRLDRLVRSRILGDSTPPDTYSHVFAQLAPIRSIMLLNLALFEAARQFAPEIAHCNDLDTLLAGFMLKTACGASLVFDAHEVYPEQFSEDMRTDLWHSFYTNLEHSLVHAADARLTVCDAISEYFADHYRAPGFVTVRNVPSIRYLASEQVLERRRDCPTILYHGAYFAHRGLDEVIKAVPHVEGARFVFRGMGAHQSSLQQLSEQVGVGKRITFAPPIGVEDLVPYASECDIGLSPFIPVCKNTEFALPNKMFEYMMAGLACASSDLVEMRRVTERHDAGVLFSALDPLAIAATLNDLLARPDDLARYRANALAAARAELNWEVESRKLVALYRPLLDGR
jgi:glycogen(starch) synthase